MAQNKINSENRYKSLASDILIFIMGTVLAKAIQFLLMPLYTTCMTTEAYGVAELTNNLSELFYPIVTLCIYEAAFRFAVDPEFDNRRLATAVTKVMITSLIIGFIITLISKYILKYKYAYYLFFILYAYSIRMCAAYYVRGSGFIKTFAFSGIVNAVTLSLFSLLFLVFLKMGVEGYLISIGFSYCCSAVYLILRSRINKSYINHIDSKRDLEKLFKYCLPLIFYNVLYWFITISGRYILLYYTDSSTAGKYVAATKIAAVINMIQQAVYSAFQLNSSQAYTEENKEEFYSQTTNIFISLYCVFGSAVVCMTPILAKLTLINEFYEANIYLPIIMLAALINCISSVLGTMYSTYKQTQRMVGASIVGAVINIAFGIILCPSIGVWGVCIASVLCYLSQIIYKFVDVRKFCKIKYNWRTIISNIVLLTIQVIIMSLPVPHKIIIAIALTAFLVLINVRIIRSFAILLLRKRA